MDLQAVINKAHAEWKADPMKAQEEHEVISRYGKMFNPLYIDKLTVNDFKSFLNFKNNKHWTGLERAGPEIYRDMAKFKRTLKLLLDEGIPINERIKRIREKNSPEYHKGLGTAYYTAILLVVYPEKYPVVNKIVKKGLQETSLYPEYDSVPEWVAYPEALPKIVELAKKNNLSLWQMDWVWWSLHRIFDYEEIYEFITNTMDPKSTYQPIMIKTILENGVASKQSIDEKIRMEDPGKKKNFVSREVYEVLVDKHRVVTEDPDGFKLNLAEPLTPTERNYLIELCNYEIVRIKENQELLKRNVSKKHLDILTKFYKNRGRYLRADMIYGEKRDREIKKSPLPPDEIVDEPHYMHNLITAVYSPADDEYALSIQLNPKSKWGLEIDRDYPTLRINYDFGPDPKYKPQISKLENCYRNGIPIGIIFKTLKAKNKILGLGKIVSFNSTSFVIDSYGISKEESTLLKEKTIKEFDKIVADPEFSRIDEVNYSDLLSEIDFNNDKFKQNLIKPLESRSVKINQIIDYCQSGEWVVPRFQRYFVWEKDQVRDFLRSITLNYYVGELLLWDIRKAAQLDVMGINGVNTNQDLRKNSIILDGQQRITSLYYAIRTPDFPLPGSSKDQQSYFYIDFSEYFKSDDSDDLIKSFYEKVGEEESFRKLLFPFYQLDYHDSWANNLEDYLGKQEGLDHKKIRDLRREIGDTLRHIYYSFEIPYITIPDDRSFEQVTDIFEKVNSSGIRLDVFDLLIARLSKYDVKLRDLWDVSRKHPKIKQYEGKTGGNKMPIYLLQSMALCFGKSRSCKRKDILDIYRNAAEDKEDFKAKWEVMTEYALQAIDLLEDTKHGFGVTVPHELPFEPMIPVLSSLLNVIDNKYKNAKKKCLDKLGNWYWTSVFSVAYSSGVDSKKTSDFKEMVEWFSNDDLVPNSIKKFRSEYSFLLDLRNVEQQSNAIYRGVLCLVALKGGYDFDVNTSIQNKRYQKDHIFPVSKFSTHENVDSILNITWLTKDTNYPTKKGTTPSQYVEETIRDKYDGNEKEFLKNLESHFINYNAYKYMTEDNIEKFIEEREKTILDTIGKKIGASSEVTLPSMTTPDTPYTNIRIIRNAIESCKGYLWWVDKYFAVADLDILIDALERADIKEVKILISLKNANEKMRAYFKRFQEEVGNRGVKSEMRVVVDTKIYGEYHDRWLISSSINYNLMSGEIAKRGQYAEIKPTENRPPFEEWWQNSLEIISRWDDIKRYRESLE